MKIKDGKLVADKSILKITDIMKSVGIQQKFISAIKRGYEGSSWNKTFDEFKKDFLGKDVILKAKMAAVGDYPDWSNGSIISGGRGLQSKLNQVLVKMR